MDHFKLVDAARALYYAAHWSADRPCNANKLWEDLRNAAGLATGNAPASLPPMREQQSYHPVQRTSDGFPYPYEPEGFRGGRW